MPKWPTSEPAKCHFIPSSCAIEGFNLQICPDETPHSVDVWNFTMAILTLQERSPAVRACTVVWSW